MKLKLGNPIPTGKFEIDRAYAERLQFLEGELNYGGEPMDVDAEELFGVDVMTKMMVSISVSGVW